MGRVYLARDPHLKRFVAVKVLLQSHGLDAEAQARFQREAQAIASISHPNVLAIYGVGELPDSTPYFIMQYVAGGSMAERLQASGPLPVDVAEGVIGDVAGALDAAHRRGIIHRDVKPANVLWDEEAERATVSDFGIAMLQNFDDETDIRITGSGMAVGSPAYMSPEQLLTEPVTPKSDIYALGLLGYELLTGRGPYNADTPHDVVAAHLRDRPRRLSEVRADIPETLQNLLLQCLAKDPADRPTAEQVMLALTPGAADSLEWPPPGLETLRGAMWKLMTMPAVGVVFLLLPMVLTVMTGGEGVGASFAVPLMIAASALLGLVAFVRAGRRAWLVGRRLARASRLKYGRGTLAEVLADGRGDTGSLIAGTREYSALTVREQSLLRALRVVRATAVFLAAPVALVVAIAALLLRGGEAGGERFFVVAVLTSLVGLSLIGSMAGFVERVRLAPARRKRAERPRGKNEKELAPAWHAAFERSREGQWFGPGEPLPSLRTALLLISGAVGVVLCATILFAASAILITGQMFSSSLSDAFVSIGGNINRSMGGVAYRITSDSSITPVEAGESLLAVASTRSRRKPSPTERRISADYPTWTRVVPHESLFTKAPGQLWTTAAIHAASRGLSNSQRALLERSARHPAREQFSRVARASSVDLYGALLELPFPPNASLTDYPSVNLNGLRDAAESQASRIALDVADGRAQDAERRAREIISVGALLLDVPVLMDNIVGASLLEQGVSALSAVYVATNRERDARVLLDTLVSATSHRRSYDGGGQRYQRLLRDTAATRGARMEALLPIVFGVCSNPRNLLFGTDDSNRRIMAYARDSIARYPSERVRVDVIERSLSNGFARELNERVGVLGVMARLVDGVVGGRRFERCANVARIFRAF